MAVTFVGDGEAGTAALGPEQDAIARTAAAANTRPMKRTTGARRGSYVEKKGLEARRRSRSDT